MTQKTGRIENDEQYQKSCDWLVKEAIRLEEVEEIHAPLLMNNPEKKAELMRKYNFVEAGILEYQNRAKEELNPVPVEQPEPEPIPQEGPEPEQKTIPPEPLTTGETSNGLEPKELVSPPEPVQQAKNWWED